MVDRSKATTLSGLPPALESSDTGAPAPVDCDTGMHKDYWVLREEERIKGFVRPLRFSYVHNVCGTSTRMATAIAETYARNPKFYGATFCSGCRQHFPIAQFHWDDGSKVGS